jgi:type II secretory pathway pseudopilin PulG
MSGITYPILNGLQNDLILTKSGTLVRNNDGTATLSREYACAISYESTADGILSLNSSPLNYTPPSDAYGFILMRIDKNKSNGILYYNLQYTGVCSGIYRNKIGSSVLNISYKHETDNYSVTYLAPTYTQYSIVTDPSGPFTAPSIETGIQILKIYKNGIPDNSLGDVTRTDQWVLTDVRSNKIGYNYILELTGTKFMTIV